MFSQAEFTRAMRNLQISPGETVRKAVSGSLADLSVIVNNVQMHPALQTLQVFSMFLEHLSPTRVPSQLPSYNSPEKRAVDCAITSLTGIGNMGNQLEPTPPNKPYIDAAKRAWTGILMWIKWLEQAQKDPRVMASNSQDQYKYQNQMVSYALYALTHDDDLQQMITASPGIIPLITKNWMDEEYPIEGKSVVSVPLSSAAMHQILFLATDELLDEVVANTYPGDPGKVADLAILRLRQAVKKSAANLNLQAIHCYIDLTISLSRCAKHPLRLALLKRGLLGWVTKALLLVSTRSLHDTFVLMNVTSCFGCISNLIEFTEGFTWVRQVIREGFLQAFVNVMPSFNMLDNEARSFTISLIRDTLPRYLVYRSVIQVVASAMRELDTPANRKKIVLSPVKESFWRIQDLAIQRSRTSEWIDENKRQMVYCDNCTKAGTKAEFKQCSGCRVTLYCSKECQVTAWKKQHKNECQLKDQERISYQSDALAKADRMFLHALTISQARMMLGTLKKLAHAQFPDTPLDLLGVKIDYTQVPPKPSVFKLIGYDIHEHDEPMDEEMAFLSPAQVKGRVRPIPSERSAGILQKAINNREKMTLIESMVSQGQTVSLILSLTARPLWSDPGANALSEQESTDSQQYFDQEFRDVMKTIMIKAEEIRARGFF